MPVNATQGETRMGLMAKKKNPPEPTPDPPEPSKRYPSRDNLRYVALPLDLYNYLVQYAAEHGSEDDTKSISWAARVAVRDYSKRNPNKKQPPPPSPPAE